MRRAHCEVTDREEMRSILDSARVGRMATVDVEGYPYITPVTFVFHEGRVYFHCAAQGEKLENLIRDPRVCFEVDMPLAYLEVGFNPERNPCRVHQLYACVIIRGKARIVPDGELKTAALNALVARHEGNWDFTPIRPDMPAYQACEVVEIEPERMTAKRDLLQNKPEAHRRMVAEHLARRGLPGDLEAARSMGYGLEGHDAKEGKLPRWGKES
jgi:hypothetical protein